MARVGEQQGNRPTAAAWTLAGVVSTASALQVGASLWLVADSGAFDARPATCLPTGCFCESVLPSGIAQPANTLSSLAFVLAALAVLLRASGLPRGIPERALAWALAGALTAVGTGSVALHGTLTYVGQLLDLQGMYLVALVVGLGALARSDRLTAVPALVASTAGVFLLAASQYALPGSRRWLFAVVLALGVVAEVRSCGWSRPLQAAMLALAVAYAVWLADDRSVLCVASSWAQGHAAWHVLTALAGYLLVEHYRTTSSSRPAVRR